jgi:hypothetical protein
MATKAPDVEGRVRRLSLIALFSLCLMLRHGPAEGSPLEQDGPATKPAGLVDEAQDNQPQDRPGGRTTSPASPAGGASASGAAPRSAQTPSRGGQGTPSAAGRSDRAPSGTGTGRPDQSAPRRAAPAQAPTTPVAPGTAAPAGPPAASSAAAPSNAAVLSRSVMEELAASPFSTQPGSFGSLEGLTGGGIPVMIGDLGPPGLHVFQQTTGPGSFPSPFPPPRPPSLPRPRGASMVVPSIRGMKIS